MKGMRKYSLALIASIFGFILCLKHCMSGGDFVACQSLILGLYKAANVIDKKLGGAG